MRDNPRCNGDCSICMGLYDPFTDAFYKCNEPRDENMWAWTTTTDLAYGGTSV